MARSFLGAFTGIKTQVTPALLASRTRFFASRRIKDSSRARVFHAASRSPHGIAFATQHRAVHTALRFPHAPHASRCPHMIAFATQLRVFLTQRRRETDTVGRLFSPRRHSTAPYRLIATFFLHLRHSTTRRAAATFFRRVDTQQRDSPLLLFLRTQTLNNATGCCYCGSDSPPRLFWRFVGLHVNDHAFAPVVPRNI